MPLDSFAALSAMIRAEAARADEPKSRRRTPGPGSPDGPGPDLGPGPDPEPVAADHDESGTSR
jgi:hypothetical protein